MLIKTKTRGIVEVPEDKAPNEDGYGKEHYCPNGHVRSYFVGWEDKKAVPDATPPSGKHQKRLYGLLKDKPTFGELIAVMLDENPAKNLTKSKIRGAAWTVWNMVNNRILKALPPEKDAETSDSATPLTEGRRRTIRTTQPERNAKAVKACIDYYLKIDGDLICQGCGYIKPEELSGRIIQIHHIDPVSTKDGEYVVDPAKDLIPLCPNCHSVAHDDVPPMNLEELTKIVNLD